MHGPSAGCSSREAVIAGGQVDQPSPAGKGSQVCARSTTAGSELVSAGRITLDNQSLSVGSSSPKKPGFHIHKKRFHNTTNLTTL